MGMGAAATHVTPVRGIGPAAGAMRVPSRLAPYALPPPPLGRGSTTTAVP
jgi:hypothetical protein